LLVNPFAVLGITFRELLTITNLSAWVNGNRREWAKMYHRDRCSKGGSVNDLPSLNSALDWVANELCEFLESVRELKDPQRREHVWESVEAHIETKYQQRPEVVENKDEVDCDDEDHRLFCLKKKQSA